METTTTTRPTWPVRMFLEAKSWSEYSTCLKRRVGAVIFTTTFQVLSTGYNDTQMGAADCGDGGCKACAETAGTGEQARGRLDCECVHAEMNAILLAARNGQRLEGNWILSTYVPCPSCRKHIHQAGLSIWPEVGALPGWHEQEFEYDPAGWLRLKEGR